LYGDYLDTIDITLPVTRAAAERLREPSERLRLGALLSMAIASQATPGELAEAARPLGASADERRAALRSAFAAMQRASHEAEITPDEIEKELVARKRQRLAAARRGAAARRR
jgi:hypothetical protein